MRIETTALGTVAIIVIMVVVTVITRWGGVFLMSFVPISDRVERFISAMSGSVLVAIVAPMAVAGDHGARLALLTTALVTLLLKKPLPAIAAGVISAAVFRQV